MKLNEIYLDFMKNIQNKAAFVSELQNLQQKNSRDEFSEVQLFLLDIDGSSHHAQPLDLSDTDLDAMSTLADVSDFAVNLGPTNCKGRYKFTDDELQHEVVLLLQLEKLRRDDKEFQLDYAHRTDFECGNPVTTPPGILYHMLKGASRFKAILEIPEELSGILGSLPVIS